MRVGEDLRQLDALGEHYRLAQGLPHRVIGQREPGGERQDDQPGKQRSAAGEAQQSDAQSERRGVEEQRHGAGPARARDVPRHQPGERGEREPGVEMQQRKRLDQNHGERM